MSVLRAPPSDEFDVFGNYVSVESRQLCSEERRRRLKRIMQRAIIDMGEEEDRCEKIGSTCSSENYSNTVSDWASSIGFSNQNPHENLITLSNLSAMPQQIASDSSICQLSMTTIILVSKITNLQIVSFQFFKQRLTNFWNNKANSCRRNPKQKT